MGIMAISREKIKQLMDNGVLQAYALGKSIEVKNSRNIWEEIFGIVAFDSPAENYRVKPTPQYRPYEDSELYSLVGKVVQSKNESMCCVVLYSCHIYKKVKLSNDQWYTSEKLMELFMYPNGATIGVQLEQ